METVQRTVMLLKPDGHIPGQWDNGATLKLSAVTGGMEINYQSKASFGEDSVLTLFMRNGSGFEAGNVSGTMLQAKIGGVRPDDVAGAALIRQGDFILKSSGLNWNDIISHYRFKHAQDSAAPIEVAADEAASLQASAPQEPQPLPQESESDRADSINNNEPVESEPAKPVAQTAAQESAETCSGGMRQSHIDPFPGMFPGSEWVKVSYPGPTGWWHYISGRARVNGCDTDVIGVPGDYSMAPPVWLDGFSTYVRCTSGDARGYWLMFQDLQTGRVLDINRSRHGG